MPKQKRKQGYFCLPVVWNAVLVARMDCKAERETGALITRNLILEPTVKKFDRFADALAKEAKKFVRFNGCNQLVVDACRTSRSGNCLLRS